PTDALSAAATGSSDPLNLRPRAPLGPSAIGAVYNPRMTERVTFPSTTGDTAMGALALPAGTDNAPAIVVIQEGWGVNDQIKAVTENWAAEGFIALAVDLYRGKVIEIG